MEDRGCLGGLFGNSELLWFIILFLLLFYCNRGCGVVATKGC